MLLSESSSLTAALISTFNGNFRFLSWPNVLRVSGEERHRRHAVCRFGGKIVGLRHVLAQNRIARVQPGVGVIGTVAELKQILAEKRREDFYRCLSEKMLTYAIGRGVEYYDSVTISRLVDHLETHDGKLVELIHAITTSAPFQMRRGDD